MPIPHIKLYICVHVRTDASSVAQKIKNMCNLKWNKRIKMSS